MPGRAHHRYRIPEVSGIGTLTPTQTAILKLRCVDDLTIGEIAAMLGKAHTTIKNHNSDILHRTGYQSMNAVCYQLGKLHGESLPDKAMRAEQV